jgi:hypothetical protein
LYLVQEILWEVTFEIPEPIWIFEDRRTWEPDEATFRCANPEHGRPVKLFTDKRSAEHFRAECEKKARQARNPFLHGEALEDLTSMPPGVFHDWLADANIAAPPVTPFDPVAWYTWWQGEDLTEEQREKVWQALDRVPFFTVVQVEAPAGGLVASGS